MSEEIKAKTVEQLERENGELRLHLAVSQATLNAIRNIHEDTLSEKGINMGNIISLSLSQTSSQTFFEKMPGGAIILSPEGRILYCNPHFAAQLNIPVESLVGSLLDAYMAPGNVYNSRSIIRQYLNHKNDFTVQFKPKGKSQPLYLNLSLNALSDKDNYPEFAVVATDVSVYREIENELRETHNTLEKRVADRTANLAQANDELSRARIATLSMMADNLEVMNQLEITNAKLLTEIGERTKSEVKLEEANEQLRALTSRIVTVREEERAALSREIHDELGSALTGVKMGLMHIKRTLPENETTREYAQINELLSSMTNIIDGTIRMVRKIITDLRPEILDEVGLAEALQWYAREFEKRTGMSIQFTVFPRKFDLDKQQTTELFRIFQEILANIAKHSGASKVIVFLKKEQTLVTLRVKDDGIGIKDSDMANKNSFGLIGIRERTGLMGGHMNIKGIAGKGTTITIEVPLKKTVNLKHNP